MDNNYILGPNGELYHWGIKGMHWGVRRYQNKDGSLTAAGKKRYKSTEEELKEREKVIKNKERAKARQAKLDAKKAELDAREKALEGDTVDESVKSKAKTIDEMTDQEINDKINRMALEKRYNDTVAANKPKPVEPKTDMKSESNKSKNIDTTSKKKLSEMTDEEINARIERLNLEKSYKEAVAKQKTADMGRTKKFINKFVDSTLDKVAENVAADLVAQAIKVVAAKGINKALESKGFATDVHTNNKRK